MVLTSILVSALLAGVVATAVTVAIEKWGGLVGGLLGTVPSTIVPAGIGMYLAGGEDDFVASMMVVPLGMLLNALFLGAWLVLPRWFSNASRPLLLTSIGALAFWCVMGMGVWFILQNTVVGMLLTEQEFAAGGLVLLFLIAVWFNRRPQPAPKGSNAVSKTVLIARGSMAALAIGVAVWMAGLGFPLLAGLASVFPAIFLTSMVALWLAQGPTVPQGAAGPMMLRRRQCGRVREHRHVVASRLRCRDWLAHRLGWFSGRLVAAGVYGAPSPSCLAQRLTARVHRGAPGTPTTSI
jgi:hypothetical protein